MDAADKVRSSDSIGGSVIGNGLTSDILRARAIQYYNNCHPHVQRATFQNNAIHKSGSMTQINGFVNGVKTNLKVDQSPCHNANRPSLHRYRNDRPHRTHSERSNKSPVVNTNLNHMVINNGISSSKLGLYRSNSSLDLDHSGDTFDDHSGVLRRDYGSASSLDIISTTGESFFAMLREFRRENFDQRSPGPAKIHEYLKGKIDPTPSTQNASNTLANGPDSFEESSSPKIKTKFHKLWDIKDKSKMRSKMLNSEPSIFKKLRGNKSDVADCTGKGSDNSLDAEARIEDKLRKKAFAHYDCQSVIANLSYASRLRSLLSKRRNTTTGASAASMLNRTPANSTENLNPEDSDPGDGRSSELLLSCPFFRNELGGEEERIISLNRMTCKKQKIPDDAFGVLPTVHKPNMAYGVSVLEKSSSSRWSHKFCPYQRQPLQRERVGTGALYYRHFFHTQEHQNWFGIDENLGPVAISIKREKIDMSDSCSKNNNSSTLPHYQYRIIIRTSELLVMRGTVLEEAVPNIARSSQPRQCHAKEVVEYIAPELHLPCLRLAVPGLQTEEHLLRLDEQGITKNFKVGVMYCKAGQSTEEEMYNNEFAGPAFEEFLDMLGQRIRLKGFDKYRGGLDTKTDTTGLYSIFTTHQDCEVMFHVSTLLPYTPNNKQQLLRKRHIGNDIVTIVFQEPDAQPFTPKNIRSQFQHVFIIVRVVNPCSDNTCYRIAVSRSKEVASFGPPISEGAIFPKSKKFADFLLSKVINAENAAHRSEKFVTMAQRTRQEYLKELASNHCTNTTIDSGPKFSILSFAGRKKERMRPRFIPDNYVLGAISWQVQAEDFGKSSVVDCLLAISVDTLVVMDETTQEVIFVCPCASILGWTSQTTSLKIFYHQGECLVIRSKDPDIDEIQEIVSRLSAVTDGAETQELILRRNSLGQLGFHVQFEGVITEVENYGFAWQAGLRQGSRLVEICKVAVATLTYDQMVDLLKTSMTVSVTVIPPLATSLPRKGCNLHNCSYLSGGGMGDYENIGICDHGESHHKTTTPRQQSAFHSQRMSSRKENNSSNQHPNRSPSMDRILSKTDVRNIFGDSSRRDHLQHHSIISLRNIQDSSQGILPSRLTTYAGIGSLASVDKEASPKASTAYPTPRSSPNSHDHGLPTYGNIQSHLHRSFHDRNRNGVSQRLTHIGGMVSARSELSLAEIMPFHSRSHSHHVVLCPHSSVKSHPTDSPSVQSRSPHSPNSNQEIPFAKRSPSSVHSDYHSDSSSDWHQGTSSADELCETRMSNSPHRHSSESKSNSATHQSRKLPESTQSKLSRLRPGVTSCSTRPTKPTVNFVAIASSGSSCSGSTSTLQEDLFKLINPEYLDSDSNSEDPPSSHLDSDTGSRTHVSTPSSSLERSNGNTPDPALDVILTKAQPAHVIASEPSSPAASDVRLDRLSPRATQDRVQNKFKPLPRPPSSPSSLVPLNDDHNIDWSSLVSSTTKGIESLPNGSTSWLEEAEKHLIFDGNSLEPKPKVHELEVRLMKMQQDLLKEQHQKANLEHEVLQLREQNQRLQEESQSAAVQIRKYREWLLQTREAQS